MINSVSNRRDQGPSVSRSSLSAFIEARIRRWAKRPSTLLRWAFVPIAWLILVIGGAAAQAQAPEEALTPENVQIVLDNIWVLIASVLVIFMNAGFAMLEAGFCRQKNAVNILAKNLIVFALATLAFWGIGFGLMFHPGTSLIGTGYFFLSGIEISTPAFGLNGTLTGPLFFLFQAAFAGTAATIVSGAVAERIKFTTFIIFSLLLTAFAYPITGHWVWGGGWLSQLETPFYDFAGSTVVHMVGGWSALTGVLILGPRIGKYRDGQSRAIPGHSMSIATLGCLILWIGWFGFNPGSQLAADLAVPYIAVTTNLAAAAGGIAATLTAWLLNGKPDLSMIINGILAGLVAVTAGCAAVTYGGAVLIGLVAGGLVVFAVGFFDRMQIDDPVGATSVHLVCGGWGTLAVGLFNIDTGLFYTGSIAQLISQIIGTLSVGLFTVVASASFWFILKATLGMRVSSEEEMTGLDISEHAMEAYSGFIKDSSDLDVVLSGREGH